MKRKVTIILTFYLTSIGLFAQMAPSLINYQGKLTDVSGNPLPTTDYSLTFNLFDAPTGGNLIWGPQIFDGTSGTGHGALVPVVQGFFNVILGPLDTGNDSIRYAFSGPGRYLEISVDGGSPITPRQQILSAPFAVEAGNGSPIGTIIAYYLSAIPDGWLLCDGRTLVSGNLSDSRYDKLKNLLSADGFSSLPDLRGRFLLGKDNMGGTSANRVQASVADSVGQGTGTETHTLTVAQMPSHNHTMYWWHGGGPATAYTPSLTRPSTNLAFTKNTEAAGGSQAHNNMPPYLTVNYLIKF